MDGSTQGKRAATPRTAREVCRLDWNERSYVERQEAGATDCVPADTVREGWPCPPGHVRLEVVSLPLEVESPHDLEQACVIGQAQLVGSPGDVPVVPLQGGNHDLALGLGLQ